MSERKLDFTKGKVEVLTLDELKQTHRENYPDGNPVGDIYHFDGVIHPETCVCKHRPVR